MGATPDPNKVREAIAANKPGADGRVLKVLYLDDKGEAVGESAPTQLPENPWDGVGAGKELVPPPFDLPQLTFLAEMHPVHSSALDQKTADVCGGGWVWKADDPLQADSSLKEQMESWLQDLAPDEFDTREIIAAMWLDVETTGWGMLEITRTPDGKVAKVYPVPAHTVKAHKNGFALCQARDRRKVYFKRWGATDPLGQPVFVNKRTGKVRMSSWGKDLDANDLFVVRRPSRRSSYYGIPGYISSMGWITLALAARDDNIYYFANRREPKWAIVLSGLSEDTEIEEDIRRAFTVDLRQPYRNIMLPLSGKDAKIDFTKMSDTQKDGSFPQLSERADKAIMISHRVPGERLANSTVGALGGNIASEANRVYKEGVVAPAQEILNARLNTFIRIEFNRTSGTEPLKRGEKSQWELAMQDLDIRSDREDLDQSVIAFHGNLITLREGRTKIGLGPLMKPKDVPAKNPDGTPKLSPDPVTGEPTQAFGPPEREEGSTEDLPMIESEFNDKLFTELPGSTGQAGTPGATPPGESLKPTNKSRNIESEVYELLRQSRETHARLVDLTDDLS